jgi:hypothetical protein
MGCSWCACACACSYVGNACPWCHRVTLAHALKGLSQAQVSYSSMDDDPERASRGGWAFSTARPDPLFNAKDLRQDTHTSQTHTQETMLDHVPLPLAPPAHPGTTQRIVGDDSPCMCVSGLALLCQGGVRALPARVQGQVHRARHGGPTEQSDRQRVVGPSAAAQPLHHTTHTQAVGHALPPHLHTNTGWPMLF